jgi:pimeloyl-ACP methyl ester carboxylesterase
MPSYLNRKNAPSLAYHYSPGQEGTDYPPVVFLGGFKSDMEGTKATFLEERCKERGQAYLRFDYRGHGQSEGNFEDGCISEWALDAQDVITHCVEKPALLVGSSMGGWIALLLAVNNPHLLQGLIGLAAAPDFTTWIEAEMKETQKAHLRAYGYFDLSNDYGDPYKVTQKMLDDGRAHTVLDKNIALNLPVRLIQGKKDADVHWKTAEKIKGAMAGCDIDITYLEDADHRLSAPDELDVIWKTVEDLSA